jgi:hypothetical protein
MTAEEYVEVIRFIALCVEGGREEEGMKKNQVEKE